VNSLQAKSTESELFTADSLYKNQQYSEAIKIYNNLFEAQIYTPNMLLKMARVMEGQEKLGLTIFYLEKYYELTQEQDVLNHIEKLSAENTLNGFSYDPSYFMNEYYKLYRYHALLIILLLVVGFLIKELVTKKSTKKNYQPKKSGFAVLLFFLLLSSIILNNFEGYQYGITINNPTYSMKGPSAGSDVHESLDKATKVSISEEVDMWTKALLNDKEIYIRTDHLKKL
jgi:hypothetical protein